MQVDDEQHLIQRYPHLPPTVVLNAVARAARRLIAPGATGL